MVLNVGTVSLSNGAKINSSSTSGRRRMSAHGGECGHHVCGRASRTDASTMATSAEANHGGDIYITAQSVATIQRHLDLLRSSRVTPLHCRQMGDGNAGNITVHSGSTFVMNNSSMTTEASQASGGQIEIIAPEMVRLTNSQVSTSVAGSEADTAGGNITIDPQFVVLQNSQIIAQAFAGTGGDYQYHRRSLPCRPQPAW